MSGAERDGHPGILAGLPGGRRAKAYNDKIYLAKKNHNGLPEYGPMVCECGPEEDLDIMNICRKCHRKPARFCECPTCKESS